MIRNLTFCSFFLAIISLAQPMPKESLISSLSKEMKETSGLIHWKGDIWITLNDGGGTNELFFFKGSKGSVAGKLKVNNAENQDWEALTKDEEGNVYIGDFGNNLNKRRQLVIYKIAAADLQPGQSVDSEKITFTYEDQKGYPPGFENWHYDVEAMVVLEDEIHLFTKNRGRPFNGYTYRYTLSNEAGIQQAVRVDSLNLGVDGIREEFWVSSAYYDYQEKSLALLSYQRLFLIPNWQGGSLGDVSSEYRMTILRQREALAKVNDEWYTTEESGGDHLAHFYHLDLEPDTLFLHKKVVDTLLVLRGFTSDSCRMQYEVFDELGRRMLYGIDSTYSQGRLIKKYDVRELPKGDFVFFAKCGEAKKAFTFSKRTAQSKAILTPADPGRK